MTVHIRLCTNYDAPPSRVWKAIERIETHTDWMADAQRITFVSDAHAGVGTELICLTRVGPLHTNDRMHVTEWEPEAVLGIEHRGAVVGRGRFTLHPDGAETRF